MLKKKKKKMKDVDRVKKKTKKKDVDRVKRKKKTSVKDETRKKKKKNRSADDRVDNPGCDYFDLKMMKKMKMKIQKYRHF